MHVVSYRNAGMARTITSFHKILKKKKKFQEVNVKFIKVIHHPRLNSLYNLHATTPMRNHSKI